MFNMLVLCKFELVLAVSCKMCVFFSCMKIYEIIIWVDIFFTQQSIVVESQQIFVRSFLFSTVIPAKTAKNNPAVASKLTYFSCLVNKQCTLVIHKKSVYHKNF